MPAPVKEEDAAKTSVSEVPKDAEIREKSFGGCALDIIIACGLFLLICNLTAGMIFWRGWVGGLILAIVGYLCFWGGIVFRSLKTPKRSFVLFTLSNFAFLYYGNLWLVRGNLSHPQAGLILNLPLGWLFILGLLLLLVPRRQSNLRLPILIAWVGISILAVSYVFKQNHQGHWAMWLFVDLIGIGIFINLFGRLLESLGYNVTFVQIVTEIEKTA